jgi:hypothetical protein
MPTKTKYADGYQDALKDVAAALTADGEDGVRNWLADNLGREDLRPPIWMHDRSGDPDYSERDEYNDRES